MHIYLNLNITQQGNVVSDKEAGAFGLGDFRIES